MTRLKSYAPILYGAAAIVSVGFWHPASAQTWTDAALPAHSGVFTISFDAVPSVVGQDTVIGLSKGVAAQYTDLAAIVRFNNTGHIDVRNGGTYAAKVSLAYAAKAKYLVRMVVDVPTHTYSVFVTPPGQAEVALAQNYAFRTEQATVSSLGYENEGSAFGTVAVSQTVAGTQPVAGTAACPFAAAATAAGISDDGCAGAGVGTPQYPTLLSKYGSHRPPFDVAGVDYPVGVPAGALKDPSIAALPAGCGYAYNVVTCRQGNVVISGYDFSLHGEIQLAVTSGIANVSITGNKFSLGTACNDPVISINAGGQVNIAHNTFDGGGALCSRNLVYGTIINGNYPNATNVNIEYNNFYNTPQDAIDSRGPSSGAASFTTKYNLFYLQGFTGHPDGTQFNGGNFDPIDVSFNTYYTTSPPNTVAGTQPFHIEAQLTAALSNSTVAYNTMLTPGSCQGGRNWPNGCAINFDISCKNDSGWVDSNTNFTAYGNYIDWSGAIAALSNGYQCPTTSWGKPAANIDLNTGGALVP